MRPDAASVAACGAIARRCGWGEEAAAALEAGLATAEVSEPSGAQVLFAALRASQALERPLFLYFDWKESVSELVWALQALARRSFGLDQPPPLGPFTEPDTIALYEDGVFEHFGRWLSDHGLELLYIETPGDHYALLLARLDDRGAMHTHMAALGLTLSPVVPGG